MSFIVGLVIGVALGIVGLFIWSDHGLSKEEKEAIDDLYERMKNK